MANITKRFLKKHDACKAGYYWFVCQNEKDEIKVIKKLMAEDRFDWANWVIVRRMEYKQYIEYACFAARQVLDNYEKEHPENNVPRFAIEAAEKCIKNPTKKNKEAAHVAAHAAVVYADVTHSIDAVYAAYAAAHAAMTAAFAMADHADHAANPDADKSADKTKERIINNGIKILLK